LIAAIQGVWEKRYEVKEGEMGRVCSIHEIRRGCRILVTKLEVKRPVG
jgi:hypothetical protein